MLQVAWSATVLHYEFPNLACDVFLLRWREGNAHAHASRTSLSGERFSVRGIRVPPTRDFIVSRTHLHKK